LQPPPKNLIPFDKGSASNGSAFFYFRRGGADQLKAGEINLIETTPEEAEAAKARLDAHRKKRRARHAGKKAATN